MSGTSYTFQTLDSVIQVVSLNTYIWGYHVSGDFISEMQIALQSLVITFHQMEVSPKCVLSIFCFAPSDPYFKSHFNSCWSCSRVLRIVFNELQLTASAASANCFPAGVQAGSRHVLGRMTNVATDFKCHSNTFQCPPPLTREKISKENLLEAWNDSFMFL